MNTARSLLVCGLLAAGAAQAQVFKCTDATGRIIFTDHGCTNSQTGGVVQKRTTERQRMQADWDAYVANNEKLLRREREQEQEAAKAAFYAEEHARQAAQAQSMANDYDRSQRQQRASVQSTLGKPNGVGGRGMTAAQREAALARATTQRERDALLDEATTVHPGSNGLTAAQRSAANRLINTDAGKPIPADPEVMRRAMNPPLPAVNTPSQIASCDPGGCMDTNGNRLNNAGGGNFTSTDGKFCTRIGPNQVICN